MGDPKELIELLLDVTARIDERDDAAVDLGGYDTPEIEEALRKIGGDSSTPDIVRASCGESLGEIWNRRGQANIAFLETLTPLARREAESRFLGSPSNEFV